MLIQYIRNRIFTLLLVTYTGVSVIIAASTSVDVTIPCLIRLVTGERCWGCGLTTATIRLFQGDITGAMDANRLVFLVLPLVMFLLVRDLWVFQRNFSPAHLHRDNTDDL
ncbi:MAG: DUF2752 domain-containing protein [Flavobacteriales bacterium]|nr:DUF2752 domain-containing protein [Flavobacteriales bacterium]